MFITITFFKLQELIQTTEGRKKKDEVKRISKIEVLSWTQNILCWGFILGIISAISWATVEILDIIYHKEELFEDINFGMQMSVSLGLSLVLWLLPMIFTLFSRYLEEYSVLRRNYTDLSRIFLLETVLLLTIAIKHISKASQDRVTTCWENEIGQQMYQLLVLFGIILVIMPLLLETVQGLVYQR